MPIIEKNIDLEAEKRVLDRKLRQHIVDNRIEFFDGVPAGWEELSVLDSRYPDLKLKGANPIQAQIIEAWKDLNLKVFAMTGANRVGKTVCLTIVGVSVMVGEWLWSGEKIQFGHGLPRKVRYVGQDWEKHIKSVVIPALNMWFPNSRELTIKKNSQGVESLWTDVKSKSTLEIMSNKQESDLHEGWEGDLVLYDEPPKRDIRVANARGLVDREGREFFAMTLLKEAWVHREVIKRLDKDGRPDKTVFAVNGDISVNVGFGLTQIGVDQFEKTLKPEEIEARLRGKPSYLSGLIFPKFDRHIHVKERFDIPLDWLVDIAIDWHPSKGWYISFMATDNLNRKWVFDEIVVQSNYKWICEELVRRINKQHLRISDDIILIDPLAKSGSQGDLEELTVYDKLGDLLVNYGYNLMTASKQEASGIVMINEFLVTESEEPAFFVFRDCVETIKHIEDWMWKDGKPDSENEDMCENIYRMMLKDTKFYPFRKKALSIEGGHWKTA